MVSEKTLMTKVKSLKNLVVKVLKEDESGKVLAFVALYNKMGIGNRLPMGLKDINELWDQQSPKRPKGYWVYGDLFNNEGDVGASCFASDEYIDNTPKDIKAADKLEWREVCELIASK